MKNFFIVMLMIVALFAFAPFKTSAHVDEGGVNDSISAEEFDEMQDVMLKMMNGEDLTDEEWTRMSEFMDGHHGTNAGQMMGDMMVGNQDNFSLNRTSMMGGDMMTNWNNPFSYWLFTLNMLIWLIVGILISVFLFRKLNK